MSVRDVNGKGPIDWQESYKSLKKNYINPRLTANYSIDIFYHTYESESISQVEYTYKPQRSRITKHFTKNRFAAQQTSLLLALELAQGKEYDEICVSRFDLLFLSPVTEWRIDPGAFNVPFRDIDSRKHCDVLWIFPGFVLEEIIRDLRLILQKPPHHNARGGELHYYRPKSIPIKFMFDQKFSSDTDWPERFSYNINPLYKLHRIRGGGDINSKNHARFSHHHTSGHRRRDHHHASPKIGERRLILL